MTRPLVLVIAIAAGYAMGNTFGLWGIPACYFIGYYMNKGVLHE